MEDPAQAVREGQELSVRIRDVDLERRRITLSVSGAPFNLP
ncbi:S1 RNA-binding domain-containing protein [Streptacidiphilus albus]